MKFRGQIFNNELLSALARSLLLVLVPFSLLSGFNGYFSRVDLDARVDNEHNNIYQVLSNVSSQAEPIELFDGVFKNLTGIPFPSEAFDKRLGQIVDAYPGAIDAYFFDASGRCFPVKQFPTPPRYVAQKFLETMRFPETAPRNEKFLLRLSGYVNSAEKIAGSKGEIISIGSSHDNHWGGWFQLFDAEGIEIGSLLVFIKKSLVDFDKLLENAVSMANRNYGRSLVFAWIDPAESDVIESDHPFLPDSAEKTIREIAHGQSRFDFMGHHGLRLFTRSGIAIFAMTREPIVESPIFQKFRIVINTVAVIAFIVLFPLFAGLTSLKFGLKVRLASLFLFVAVVPLITLVFTGAGDRIEREKILINDLQQNALRELTRIDESMISDYRRLEKLFRSSALKVSKVAPADFDAALVELGQKVPGYSDAIRHIHIVTSGWERTFFNQKSEDVSAKSNDTMVLYGKMLLQQIRGEYTEPESRGGVSDLQSVVNNLGGWLAKGLIMSCRRIGMLNVLDSVVPTYVDFFIDDNDYARAVCLIILSRAGLQRNFVFRLCKMRDRQTVIEGPKFAAMPVERSPEWPAFPRRSVARNPVLQKIAEQALKSGVPAHHTGEVTGKKYLLTANLAKHIDGYVLIYATPYSLVERHLLVFNRRMLSLALMIIIIALVAAKLTSHFLLSPIENLEKGLKAVSAGNFRVQLNSGGVVEFASMTESLNQTLKELQELQIAKNIQETLWPREQLGGDDWSLYGRCITASELGGDYFDWKKLDDGRVMVIIGDVTGHGIAPAMVQAAIKVWVGMYAQKVRSAGELIKQISSLHFKYGARRLYMTCWLAIFNPADGKVEYSTAGHPYPMLLKTDGSIERLELNGMPIGVRAKAKSVEATTCLKPGESLILYTDGIIEKCNMAGQILNFDGFERFCQKTSGMNPEESVEHILEQSRLWGQQNDDETVIVLRRRGGQQHDGR